MDIINSELIKKQYKLGFSNTGSITTDKCMGMIMHNKM